MAMTHEQMLSFVHKMSKLALEHVTMPQHFDSGGAVLGGPVIAGTNNAVNPANQGLGGAIGGLLGTNNNFQATGAQIQQGTNANQLNQAYTGAQQGISHLANITNTVSPGVAQATDSQNLLTNQLTNQTMGVGPNPAQAALNQNTGQNIAQQAALAAGTRGAGTNAGLIASNAAQQGANIQQQAVGQGATLQAQQELAAQNALANLAAQQVGQASNAASNESGAQLGEQGILQNANAAENRESVNQQSNINTVNSQTAADNAKNNKGLLSSVGSAIGSVGSFLGGLFAEGGEVDPKYKHLHGMAQIYHPHMAGGGNVGDKLKSGGSVPGKPMVNHDSYKNDTVSAKLSPGEVVIDLDTLKDDGKLGQMARFVAQNIERKKAGRAL